MNSTKAFPFDSHLIASGKNKNLLFFSKKKKTKLFKSFVLSRCPLLITVNVNKRRWNKWRRPEEGLIIGSAAEKMVRKNVLAMETWPNRWCFSFLGPILPKKTRTYRFEQGKQKNPTKTSARGEKDTWWGEWRHPREGLNHAPPGFWDYEWKPRVRI